MGIQSYQCALPDRTTLKAYALDATPFSALVKLVQQHKLSSDQPEQLPNLEALADEIPVKAKMRSLDELAVVADETPYEVPQVFQPFRNALGTSLPKKGMFNGPVMIVRGDVALPLHLCRGGFFDYKATELTAVPSILLPRSYPTEKTVKELLQEYGLTPKRLARYLGVAFVMLTRDGTEVGLVQRAKHLGVAPDCIALSGCTPPFTENLFEPGFNFSAYLQKCIADEMNEEYHLQPNEFKIGRCYLIDDQRAIMPAIAMEIVTPLSTAALAERCRGDEEVIREHPVLYAIPFNSIPALLSSIGLHYGTARILDMVHRDHTSKA